MPAYVLYIESGPKRRKTQVHVLQLLGCIAQGATTDEALANTPDAIRPFLRFNGKPVPASITTTIAQHVTEGSWIGQGDPQPGFPPDFEPLTAADLKTYVARFRAIHARLLELVAPLTPKQLAAVPADGHRSIHQILDHVGGAQANYLRYQVGAVEPLSAALRDLRRASIWTQPRPQPNPAPDVPDIREALRAIVDVTADRLSKLSAAERTKLVSHGEVTWSAHRCLRRCLEHGWEHLLEVSERLNIAAA